MRCPDDLKLKQIHLNWSLCGHGLHLNHTGSQQSKPWGPSVLFGDPRLGTTALGTNNSFTHISLRSSEGLWRLTVRISIKKFSFKTVRFRNKMNPYIICGYTENASSQPDLEMITSISCVCLHSPSSTLRCRRQGEKRLSFMHLVSSWKAANIWLWRPCATLGLKNVRWGWFCPANLSVGIYHAALFEEQSAITSCNPSDSQQTLMTGINCNDV